MSKGRLPEGYRGVDLIIKEFRIKNPKGKVETIPVLLGDGYVIITAKITTDDGAVGSGMADADVQEDKSIEKAESGAIRRALLTLGYESIRLDEEEEEKAEPKQEEKRSFKRDEPKKDLRSESAKEADEDEDSEDEEEEQEEKPKSKSRFGSKSKSSDDEEEEEQAEGQSKFKRGSRFTRS